jgi:hypothetical protein
MILYAATVCRGDEDPLQSRVHMYFKDRFVAEFEVLSRQRNSYGNKCVLTSVDVGNAGDALLSQLNNPEWVLDQPRKVLK